MIELQTVTTKAKNPSTNEFQDVTWGGINVLSTSGTTNYNNLTNKPTINGVTVQGSLTTGDLLITAADVGALPSGTKYGADFALTIDSQTFIVTAQLKDQDGNNLGQAKTIDLPLETMVVGGRYDDTTQKVILTLKNGQTVEFSVADLVNGLQSEITLNNKLDADLIDDSASTNKLVTASEKATWNGKQDTISDLSEIRSGAAAGSTAVQQTTFETDQQRQEIEIGVVANAGAKNLLDYTFSINGDTNNRISNGVTFTINTDGSISTSGTASALITSVWIQMDYVVPSDPVILSGCPAGGANNTYRIDILDGSPTGSVVAADYGNGVLIKSSMFTNGIGLIRIRIANGQNVDGLVFKPMIRRAEITDDTFIPYAKTNRELTVAGDEDRAALIAQVDSGAKNRLNYNFATFGDKSKVTINQDGSITGSITSDTRQYNWTNREFEFTLPAGDYVFRINRLAGDGVYTSARLMTAENTNLCTVATNPNIAPSVRSFTLDTDTTVGFIGKVFTDTIQLMLCTATDYATSPVFVPYAPTNRELYEMIQALTATITPMTQNEYDALVTKDKPIYFVYET